MYLYRENYLYAFREEIKSSRGWNKYKQKEPWTKDPASSDEVGFKSSILFKACDLRLPKNQADQNVADLENAKKLHQALPGLKHNEAANEKLWATLSHFHFWKYMRKRWPVETPIKAKQKGTRGGDIESYLKTHYFFLTDTDRALYRNGISRLWWFAELTHDESREDPYELTEALLTNTVGLDVAQGLLERTIGRVPVLLHASLEFMKENEGSRDKYRKLYSLLNYYGGCSLIDSLSKPRIKGLLKKTFDEAA